MKVGGSIQVLADLSFCPLEGSNEGSQQPPLKVMIISLCWARSNNIKEPPHILYIFIGDVVVVVVGLVLGGHSGDEG